MNSRKTKFINLFLFVSGVFSFISGIGYVVNEITSSEMDIPFGIFFVFSVLFFVFLLSYIFFIAKNKYEVQDVSADYSIFIKNSKGDAVYERKSRIEVSNKIITKREHHAFSDGSKMEYEELNLEAWDKNGNKLAIKPFLDNPTSKKFHLIFAKNLKNRDNYEYSYRYHWKKLFPNHEDYFILSDTALQGTFTLILAKKIGLKSLEGIEQFQDGEKKQVHLSLIEKKYRDDGNISHKYSYEKQERHTKVIVNWIVDYR